ncbi:uncharacterized protein [Coffea arabica]|uniref:Uncharacterized protein isoform X1 n=1 Tax=Coffea arabica TaxID=13443 RepID=A0A6P6XCC6_COFAR|nr:uncharacterized protein At3g61260-like isoform X1 [Coffea arabica]XP_027125400.1 uncharacterized protein At3g61260-like isoform X1 [Coffea arabica]
MRRGYDYVDGDQFATAVAASAFAIHSLEEYQKKLRKGSEIALGSVRTRKDERSLPIETASSGRPFGQGNRTTSFARPVPFAEQKQKGNSKKYRNAETKADAWEKAQMAKIKKRYERMQSDILAWEHEKKMQEKLQLEKKKSELELRRERNLQHYRSKLARIDHNAGGARKQIEEKRKYEESVVKEKARKIRSTGNAPLRCFCF